MSEPPQKLSASAGEIPVEPRRTTTYRFHASGPGGIVNQEATVDVDPTVQASLETKPAEVHYLKVGDKVLLQDSAQLQWVIPISQKLPLSEAAEAQAEAEKGGAGKILLVA